jgi:hypothetical protein
MATPDVSQAVTRKFSEGSLMSVLKWLYGLILAGYGIYSIATFRRLPPTKDVTRIVSSRFSTQNPSKP